MDKTIPFKTVVDTSKVNKLIADLNMSSKETKRATKLALRTSAGIIRKEAMRLFPNIKNAKERRREINIAVYRNASGARIDLLDKKNKSSKAFTLKFFDAGTQYRATNKGHNRGYIKATWFFKNAVENKKKEAEHNLEDNVLRMIRKIASKRK